MNRIAVDCVLLPSEQMMDKAIAANERLCGEGGDEIVLSRENCLPHISLVMGCICESDVTVIGAILQDIAKQFSFDKLTATNICVETSSTGRKVSVLQIETTRQLQELHEMVSEKLSPYMTYDVTEDMLFDSSVSRSTLLWIKNYRGDSSFKNFFPHITLGYGQLNDMEMPIEFTPKKLALCHLGDNCTCKKIMAATKI